MTIRLSDAARNAMLGDGVNQGLRGGLALGFIAFYDGTQPASPNTGSTGNLLAKVTLNDGVTGLSLLAAAAGVLAKTAAVWQFTGLMNGTVGWYRYYQAGDTPTATDATKVRVDGLVGTAGADLNISNTSIVLSAVSTVDTFSFTEPAA